jgi:hypothetical protein
VAGAAEVAEVAGVAGAAGVAGVAEVAGVAAVTAVAFSSDNYTPPPASFETSDGSPKKATTERCVGISWGA